MEKCKEYLVILIDSLKKKIEVLDSISLLNNLQASIIKEDKFDAEAFDETVDKKESLINKLNILDVGFESVYDRIKEEITSNLTLYKEEIKQLKELIATISDLTIKVQAEEARNKEAFTIRKEIITREIKSSKATNLVAAKYYNTMSNTGFVDPQFLDKKK